MSDSESYSSSLSEEERYPTKRRRLRKRVVQDAQYISSDDDEEEELLSEDREYKEETVKDTEWGPYIQKLVKDNDSENVNKTIGEALKSILDYRDSSGKTSLFWAAAQGHTDTLKVLIDWGADIEAQDNENITPLFIAAQNGYLKAVKLLVEAKANTETLCPFQGKKYKAVEIAKKMWEEGWTGHSDEDWKGVYRYLLSKR